MLCVEVDGEQHELARERDSFRDQQLAPIGSPHIADSFARSLTASSTLFSSHIREIVRLCEERTGRVVWPNGIDL